jgi:glycosyltransferase involved in cell wall biosynthesis
MTVCNAERYLRETLDSISRQTLKDIEIVCVDFNSADSTLEIIHEYQERGMEIQVQQQRRKGIGAAKNEGLVSAIGEFITFLDADDYYLDETSLARLYTAAKKNNVNICGGFRSNLQMDGSLCPVSLHRRLCEGCPDGRLFKYRDFQYDYHFHSYLYDRSFIINSDARFLETLAYDDINFHIRAMHNAEYFYIVPVEFYCYRLHEAYAWEWEKTNQAMIGLVDELAYSKTNQLPVLHWITIQRINHEYGGLICRHLSADNYSLVNNLVFANSLVDEELIDRAQSAGIPEHIIDPMLNSRYDDLVLKKGQGRDGCQYILKPFQEMMSRLGENTQFENRRNALEKEIVGLRGSKDYRLGNKLLILPRKVKRSLVSFF